MIEGQGVGGTGDRPDARRPLPKAMNVFGRQGSPTVTLALPFARVDVRADDAAPLVASVAQLTARLARAMASIDVSDAIKAEFAAIADAADALAFAPNDAQPDV